MGERHITERYCDRCSKVVEDFVRGGEYGPTRYTASVHQDIGVGGDFVFKWEELCAECNSYLGELAEREKANQKAARQALEKQNDTD